jgi:hypothetical protein
MQKRGSARKRGSATDSKTDLILKKLSSIEKKIGALEREDKKIERDDQKIQEEDKRIEREEEKIGREEVKLEKNEVKIEHEVANVERREHEIEKVLLKVGIFSLKKKHLLELVRASAGAFLGVGLGKNLLDLKKLAETLPWFNVVGILLFVLLISALLIYKNQKDYYVQGKDFKAIIRKLAIIYLVTLGIEILSLYLFAALDQPAGTLLKMIIIGSYSAMAGAVSFSLI